MNGVSFTVSAADLSSTLLSHQLRTNSKLVLSRGRRHRTEFWKDDYHCANWAGCPFRLSIRHYKKRPDVYEVTILQPHIHIATLLPTKKRTLSELGKIITAYMDANISEIQECLRKEVQKALETTDLLTTMMLESFPSTKVAIEDIDIESVLPSKLLIAKRKNYAQNITKDLYEQ
ncbi:Hypothetical protein GLP15_1894 [Giardia lamblia P15]|uniref:Uncharacterized protein n=1 Tax=Giardia intestinalis (strain P15) TaxID=658858 RepID=E1F5Z5_GIAIA|nr:Hypothetical protein GLP15_1894 [Giardia lamblia P15]